MINGRDGTYKAAPRDRDNQREAKRQYDNNNSTTLKDSRSRYDKGLELYKSGRVSIAPNGYFKVSGFQVDTEKMQCECLDFKTRKQVCKHIHAAMLFVKNGGKQKIEHLEGNGKVRTFAPEAKVQHVEQDPDERSPHEWVDTTQPRRFKNDAPNKPVEAPKQVDSKPFDRQSTITRLAVLNTAVELLKTHRTPLEPEVVIAIAAQLEKWALGGQP